MVGQMPLYTPLPSKKLFPNSLCGEILDSMEANMSKPIWHVGRCHTEGLATWSLTSGHRTLRALPTSHQGPGNFSRASSCVSSTPLTPFFWLIYSFTDTCGILLPWFFSVMWAPLPPFLLWIPFLSRVCPPFSPRLWALCVLGNFPTLSGRLPPLFFQSDGYPASLPSFPTTFGLWHLDVISKLSISWKLTNSSWNLTKSWKLNPENWILKTKS